MRLGLSILRILIVLAGMAVMAGFYFFCRWLVTGISEQFGEGVVVGIFLTLVLVWVAWKADPESFHTLDERIKLAISDGDLPKAEFLRGRKLRRAFSIKKTILFYGGIAAVGAISIILGRH